MKKILTLLMSSKLVLAAFGLLLCASSTTVKADEPSNYVIEYAKRGKSHHPRKTARHLTATAGAKAPQTQPAGKPGNPQPAPMIITPAKYRWPTTTITYKIDSNSAYYQNVWSQAITAWNNTQQVHLVPASDAKPDITLQVGKTLDLNSAGMAFIQYYDRTLNGLNILGQTRAIVYSNNFTLYRYTLPERIHVAEHELGHALGLAHSSDTKSVMYPAVCDNNISPGDIAGLAQAYQ